MSNMLPNKYAHTSADKERILDRERERERERLKEEYFGHSRQKKRKSDINVCGKKGMNLKSQNI